MTENSYVVDLRSVEADAILAVTAHGLLNPLASIVGFAELLLERWDDLPADRRREILGMIRDRGRFAADVLTDLVRGLPPRTTEFLDSLGEETRQRDTASSG